MNKTQKIIVGVVLGLILLLGVGPFLVPVPPLEDTQPVEALQDEDSRFVTVNGLEVHYKQEGDGEPVMVLLHGFGASLYSWREVMPDLKEIGTVIAYDRPAFGLTERPLTWEGQNPYSPEAQVELVRALLDARGVDRAVLMGNSAGGTVAASFALRYPERTAALVLVDAAIYTGGGAPGLVRPLLQTPQMDHLGPLIARAIERQGDEFLRSAWHDPSQIPEETYRLYRKPLQAQNWDRALWELTKASSSSNLEERLDEFNVPVLVVTGDDDQIVPTEQSLRLAEEIPGAELAVFEDCGHVPQEECPDAFVNAVERFFQDLEQELELQ